MWPAVMCFVEQCFYLYWCCVFDCEVTNEDRRWRSALTRELGVEFLGYVISSYQYRT